MYSPKRILLVENDGDLREAMYEVLVAEGYEVLVARNGREAIDQLPSLNEPHLIVLELVMPFMNGWEFLAIHAKHPSLSAIPVIVLSADGRITADELGARGCLLKPFSLALLLETIRSALLGTER